MRRPFPIHPPTPHRPARPGGFSLIEVMVAVFIIALLAALTVTGLRKVLHSSQTNATRITLHNLRALYQEFDTASGLTRDTGHWVFAMAKPYGDSDLGTPKLIPFTVASASTTANAHVVPSQSPASMSVDFWHAPMRYAYVVATGASGGAITNASPAAALQCPISSVTDEFYSGGNGLIDRMTAPGVLDLQIAMRMFATTPVGRSAIAALPSGTLMVPEYRATAQYTTAVYAMGNVVHYLPTGSPATTPAYFRAVKDDPAVPPTNDGTNWVNVAQPDPVILDTFRNPVLFCPAGGLVGMWTGGAPGDSAAIYHVQNPTTNNFPSSVTAANGKTYALTLTNVAGPIVAPDGKAFFASAGPDGDFTTGDDNVYSFEN